MRLFSDLLNDRVKTSIIMGARTKNEVLFEHKVQKLLTDNNPKDSVAFSTDDGTFGFKGSTVDLAESSLFPKNLK